jgi:hypothetical protein
MSEARLVIYSLGLHPNGLPSGSISKSMSNAPGP